MKCRTATSAPVSIRKQGIARKLMKGYIRLLTQQTVHTVKKIDAYFFGPNGEDAELRAWYGAATAFYIIVAILLFITLN